MPAIPGIHLKHLLLLKVYVVNKNIIILSYLGVQTEKFKLLL